MIMKTLKTSILVLVAACSLSTYAQTLSDETIAEGQQDNLHSDNYQVYDLQGRRLQQEPHHGIYILRQNGKSTKIYK